MILCCGWPEQCQEYLASFEFGQFDIKKFDLIRDERQPEEGSESPEPELVSAEELEQQQLSLLEYQSVVYGAAQMDVSQSDSDKEAEAPAKGKRNMKKEKPARRTVRRPKARAKAKQKRRLRTPTPAPPAVIKAVGTSGPRSSLRLRKKREIKASKAAKGQTGNGKPRRAVRTDLLDETESDRGSASE